MTCSLRIERDGEYRLSLTFDGPVELGAALAAVVARFEAGEPAEALEVRAPASLEPAAPRPKRTSTERSQDRRARLKAEAAALHATRNATDATPATLHATDRVAVASASLSGSLPSLSPAFPPSLGENARKGSNGGNGATATDATPLPVAPVDLDAPMPSWAADRVETLAISMGPWPETFVALEAWRGYLGNLAKARDEGRVLAASPGGWQKWLVDQRAIERRNNNGNGRRVVQRDPPGPKPYRQASHEDPWDDDEEKSA